MKTTQQETRCFIGLGANLGNPAANIKKARNLIAQKVGTVESCSILYDTLPMTLPGDTEEQPPYVNAVLSCSTTLSPADLLSALQAIESEIGLDRSKKKAWGAREIDLDILTYGDKCVLADGLSIPHPEMQKRDFVLIPLREICPGFVHPVLGYSIEKMIYEFNNSDFVRTLEE